MIDPNFVQAYLNRARLYQNTGRKELAQEDLINAADVQQRNNITK